MALTWEEQKRIREDNKELRKKERTRTAKRNKREKTRAGEWLLGYKELSALLDEAGPDAVLRWAKAGREIENGKPNRKADVVNLSAAD